MSLEPKQYLPYYLGFTFSGPIKIFSPKTQFDTLPFMDTEEAIQRYREARQSIRRAIQCYEQQELALFRQMVEEINAIRNSYPDSVRDEPARALAHPAQKEKGSTENHTTFLTQENTNWCPPDFPNSRRP